MQRYWIRIVAGAFAVFAIGFYVYRLGQRGVERVSTLVTSTEAVTIPTPFFPFRLDRERLGTVRNLELLRAAPDRVREILVTVALDDSATAGRLERCNLAATDLEKIDNQFTFRCVDSAEAAELVRFGAVMVEQTGQRLPLLLPASDVAEWTSDSATSENDGAVLRISANGRDVVRIEGDSSRALIEVRDSNGREVVVFRADSNGAHLKVEHPETPRPPAKP